ncbi:MAG: GHKL domain-containing protein [Prevotellaceae bacterium]|jgi:signal transduction histidine kinase|nr:GHKL domain-containing protein [Prevotellaceae bacterium]
MKQSLLSYVLLSALTVSIVGGIVCHVNYDKSPQRALPVALFQDAMYAKDQKALRIMNQLKEVIRSQSFNSPVGYPFDNDDISYYVFRRHELVFWSDNQLVIDGVRFPRDSDLFPIELPNAYCVGRRMCCDEGEIIALIKIKNNYHYENNYLHNEFAENFPVDKQLLIKMTDSSDKNAIFSSDGHYLFSLSQPEQDVYNEKWSHAGSMFYALAFLLLLLIYARYPALLNKQSISIKTYGVVTLSLLILLLLALYHNVPDLLFSNKLFSPAQYASNNYFRSIAHLSIFGFFVLSATCLLYFFVDKSYLKTTGAKIIAQISFVLVFTLFYYILHTFIYDSNSQVVILALSYLHVFSVWVYILIFIWGISIALLFFATHQKSAGFSFGKSVATDVLSAAAVGLLSLIYTAYHESLMFFLTFVLINLAFNFLHFSKQDNYKKASVTLTVFVFTICVTTNLSLFSIEKKHNKYLLLAQNISINGNVDSNNMTDILIEELDFMLVNDNKISMMALRSDTMDAVQEYVNGTYMRGFWSRFEIRMNKMYRHTDDFTAYNEYVENIAVRINNTNFYAIPPSKADVAYIGIFPIYDNDNTCYTVELYPKRHFRSYSFPNLLIAANTETDSEKKISIAKYEAGSLIYDSGEMVYPANADWIPDNDAVFFGLEYAKHVHHIYRADDKSYIVITELEQNTAWTYLLYSLYLFMSILVAVWMIKWVYNLRLNKGKIHIGLTQKFQYTFVALLFVGFISTFYVSVNFFRRKYQNEQIQKLENKRNYIQHELQSKYYWNEALLQEDRQRLNFDLQEISYTYHVDIHVYDNNGMMIGSSQPLLFNRNLISEYIAPEIYFSENTNVERYERIGNLQYLSAYTDFYNGDYLQIGYIAVPQFFSREEVRSEIQRFVSVIIHIYIFIIIISLVLGYIIGKQLSAPLIMLENKLKNMQLGKRNDKIEYEQNDEIKRLVEQYNLTVVELEKSAELLAKSERETAWKSMARQVAHEINNPLTPMKLTIQQLRRTKDTGGEVFDDYFKKSTQTLIEQIDNLSRIASTFSNFARMPEARFEKTDIASRLCSVIQLFKSNNQGVNITYEGPADGIYADIDPEQWLRVFNNLLTNAIQAIPKGREKNIHILLYRKDKGIFIEIADNGSGITDEVAGKLFVPNFTTKNTGMGLGLAITKNIVETSGGSISFRTKVNEGSTFIINIPEV